MYALLVVINGRIAVRFVSFIPMQIVYVSYDSCFIAMELVRIVVLANSFGDSAH